MYQVRQLIAGRWEPGGAGRDLTVLNPADDAPVTRVPVSSPEDCGRAVRAAHQAAPGWARTPAADRGAALRAAAAAVEAAAGDLAETMSAEMGKPVADARDSITAGVGTLRQYAELGPVHRGRMLAGADEAVDLMAYQPRGVVAVITPWNDPVAISCGLLGAALVTGNTAILKPSERTPATGWQFARLFAPHLPDGVLGLLNGDGPVGAALAAAPADVVAHVGSTATGRSIAAACARTGAKALLENGGSDPLIVDAGVDPRWAAEQAALGAFANSGQICVSVERIYCHRTVAAHPRRSSGQGLGYGPELLDEMTVTKVVHLQAPPSGW